MTENRTKHMKRAENQGVEGGGTGGRCVASTCERLQSLRLHQLLDSLLSAMNCTCSTDEAFVGVQVSPAVCQLALANVVGLHTTHEHIEGPGSSMGDQPGKKKERKLQK
jgi:hypothetical protein